MAYSSILNLNLQNVLKLGCGPVTMLLVTVSLFMKSSVTTLWKVVTSLSCVILTLSRMLRSLMSDLSMYTSS